MNNIQEETSTGEKKVSRRIIAGKIVRVTEIANVGPKLLEIPPW